MARPFDSIIRLILINDTPILFTSNAKGLHDWFGQNPFKQNDNEKSKLFLGKTATY